MLLPKSLEKTKNGKSSPKETKTERTCIEEDNNIYSTFFIFKILFVLNMQLVSNTFKITALVRNDKNILYMHVTN